MRPHISHHLVVAFAAITFAPAAFADDSTPAPAPAPTASPQRIGNADDVPDDLSVSEHATDTAPAARYPRAVIARPLTLPAGVLGIGADAGANHDLSEMVGAPVAAYGITDKLEVLVPYTFATRDFEARGSVALDLGYAVVRGALDGKLEVIARVRGGYSALDSAATPLLLGAHVQYNVTDRLAIISGTPGSQQLRITLAENAMMAKPIDVSVPLGIGLQLTGALYMQLDTKLAQLALHDGEHAILVRDATPLALTVVYNVVHAVDVQAAIATDLSNAPADALTFLVGARYYAGRL